MLLSGEADIRQKIVLLADQITLTSIEDSLRLYYTTGDPSDEAVDLDIPAAWVPVLQPLGEFLAPLAPRSSSTSLSEGGYAPLFRLLFPKFPTLPLENL